MGQKSKPLYRRLFFSMCTRLEYKSRLCLRSISRSTDLIQGVVDFSSPSTRDNPVTVKVFPRKSWNRILVSWDLEGDSPRQERHWGLSHRGSRNNLRDAGHRRQRNQTGGNGEGATEECVPSTDVDPEV